MKQEKNNYYMTETVCSLQPKIFTAQSFAEDVCQNLGLNNKINEYLNQHIKKHLLFKM